MAEEQLPVQQKTQRELAKPGFAFLPKTWEELYGYAKEICSSDFVPRALQGKPGAVLAAWQTGMEVGLPPMASLQSIGIINGRPSIHSNGYWALIVSHPLCEWFTETPPDLALKQGYGECTVKRRGNPHPVTRRFTMEEAKTAGLLVKDNWKNYPGDMLQNRARHRAGDDALPEACLGVLPSDVARDLPPEPRDITPQDEPKPRPQMPLPTTKGEDRETGNDQERTGVGETEPGLVGTPHTADGKESTQGEADSKKTNLESTPAKDGAVQGKPPTYEERRAWIETASLEELQHNKNFALANMKNLRQDEQASICILVNDKKQALLKAQG